ncbi:MAG: hypothetical protein ACK5PQ_00045 [Alphaproteobacteria bacterium]
MPNKQMHRRRLRRPGDLKRWADAINIESKKYFMNIYRNVFLAGTYSCPGIPEPIQLIQDPIIYKGDSIGRLALLLKDGALSCRLELTEKFPWENCDGYQFVERIVSQQLSLFTLFTLRSIDVKVTNVINDKPDLTFWHTKSLPEFLEKHVLPIDGLGVLWNSTYSIEYSVFIRLSVEDFRRALVDFDNASFHCYRSLESLRHAVAKKYVIKENNKSAQWDRLKIISGFDSNIMDWIKLHADGIRHGNPLSGSKEKFEPAIIQTRDCILKVIRDLSNL